VKAVNLVPKDYRRGRLAGRGGEVFSYAVIGGLVAVLLAVVAVVLTGNKVSDNKSEVAKLQQQLDDAQTEASALAPYSNFASLAQARIATVSSLAQSRFDWERVMRELSQVIPSDVWLTKLTGTVVPDVTIDNGVSVTSRGSISGPALEIEGCGTGQDAVAKFVAALENIDGVTRVGVQSSVKPVGGAAAPSGATGGATGASGGACSTKPSIPTFQVIAAFDAAPVPATAAGGTTTPAPTTTTPTTPTTPTAPTTPDPSGAQQQQAAQQQSVQQTKDKAQKATHYIPGN
jgi:Tfp pilus assembly protein PilN